MIYAVYCPSANTTHTEVQWQSDLLGYSWGRARQPGELIYLVAQKSGSPAKYHPSARVIETQNWSRHPYTGDLYPPYQMAAGLMEWLLVENVEGTLLLLQPDCLFQAAAGAEVKPGQAKGSAWTVHPRGDGPFGLGLDFHFLTGVCVDRQLALPDVTLPVAIHSTDLRKIAPRWLELMSIIRAETAGTAQGARPDADKIAYAIAAAEAGIPHAVADLCTHAGENPANPTPLIDYRRPIPSTDGGTAWDLGAYREWDAVETCRVASGTGQVFLTLLAEVIERHAQGKQLALLKPCRNNGVREGKILGSMFLEIPGRADTVSLNSSGAAIWEACNGTRSLAEVNQELETRFNMPPGSLQEDVEVVIKRLESIGALKLEAV